MNIVKNLLAVRQAEIEYGRCFAFTRFAAGDKNDLRLFPHACELQIGAYHSISFFDRRFWICQREGWGEWLDDATPLRSLRLSNWVDATRWCL
ncbi:hypothetical protein [Alicyclobacillus kakegawensis]|uniref:hypothetical protein n=1 Tax=Alicyclobacillus kakegawensis TaxID=392012 RepID=UPI0012ED1206|nr:hypothetical protein [Alicyclobacillus kakegawensis]